jgi:hypothetical protein
MNCTNDANILYVSVTPSKLKIINRDCHVTMESVMYLLHSGSIRTLLEKPCSQQRTCFASGCSPAAHLQMHHCCLFWISNSLSIVICPLDASDQRSFILKILWKDVCRVTHNQTVLTRLWSQNRTGIHTSAMSAFTVFSSLTSAIMHISRAVSTRPRQKGVVVVLAGHVRAFAASRTDQRESERRSKHKHHCISSCLQLVGGHK